MGVAHNKSDATPLSFRFHFGIDYTFKMSYSISLNSQWFQKYKPSKLIIQKKMFDLVLKRTFFYTATLTAGIFRTTGSSET